MTATVICLVSISCVQSVWGEPQYQHMVWFGLVCFLKTLHLPPLTSQTSGGAALNHYDAPVPAGCGQV